MKSGGFIAFVVGAVLLSTMISSRASSSSQESPQQTVERVCSHCHALEILGDCVAGDCRGHRVARLLKAPPWDFVMDWMKTMGAKMKDSEQQTILEYLQTRYPAKPYDLTWVNISAGLGQGGWNVVSLQEHEGHLYAGFEGNGKIFRSTDGPGWREVASTDHYTVYGITPFQGALYAGTHNPDPQIWKSKNGSSWRLEANLPSEDRGVISLGVFKDYLYAGTGRARIYRSRDTRRWEKAAALEEIPMASFTHWVRFLIEFQGHFYAGIEGGHIYRSPDGLTWSRVGQEVTADTGVRGAAVFKGALFVGTTGDGEVWRSEDGVTWRRVFKAPPHVRRGYVASMAVAGGSLFAGIDGLIFRTLDGLDWEEVGHLGPYTIEAMAPFRGALYAGTVIPPSGHIYKVKLAQEEQVKPET